MKTAILVPKYDFSKFKRRDRRASAIESIKTINKLLPLTTYFFEAKNKIDNANLTDAEYRAVYDLFVKRMNANLIRFQLNYKLKYFNVDTYYFQKYMSKESV